MIRISIYDDNDSLRDTLALFFDTTDDLITTGTYANALTVVETVSIHQPDVILMDIDMPGRTGIEAVTLLRDAGCLPKVLMLTVYEDSDRIFAAISAGAVGYLLKKTPGDRIIEAIREVMSGGAAMTPSIALKVLSAFQKPTPPRNTSSPLTGFQLTDKEQLVLKCLVNGDSYKLIAANCQISMGTVRTHIVNIYQKLHVNSKSEAVVKAMRTGLFG